MAYIGTIETLQLSAILHGVEMDKKTGLLTVKQAEQQFDLCFQQGKLVYAIIHQEGKRNVHLYQREAHKVVHDLREWSTGEISFEEETSLEGEQSLPPLFEILEPCEECAVIPTIPLPLFRMSKTALSKPSIPPKLRSIKLQVIDSGSDTPPIIQQVDISETPSLVQQIDIPDTPPVIQQVDIPETPPVIPQVELSFSPDTDPLMAKVSIVQGYKNRLLHWETFVILAVLLIAALAHGINMFHFPYFENDEGTYMSQAWAVVHEGSLAPYTYWYDHAPVGWLQIALWALLTGGFHAFGPIIYSGRVLMLIFQIGSTFMVYRITRNISKNVVAAIIASLIFAISPYGIYYHRRILLDNISVFWMLLSILLLVSKRISLNKIWLSALFLAISILSKEVTVFIIPAMFYLVFFRADKSHRWFATVGWMLILSSIVSLYPMMALIKGEMFPSGTFLGGTAPHVSLLGTVAYQASRGKDGGLLNIHSGFWYMVGLWIRDEPMLVIGGTFCAILAVLIIKWQRLIGVMGLLTLSLWIFLGRGGEIIGFYLIPLLPLLSLCIGLFLGVIFNFLKKLLDNLKWHRLSNIAVQLTMLPICLGGMLYGYSAPDLGFQANHYLLWTSSQANAQIQAIHWVEEHVPSKSTIVVDDSMWTDLYDTGNAGSSYKSVQWYWKVDLDPAIKNNILHGNWKNIDYIVITGQMIHDVRVSKLTIVGKAIAHSTILATFNTGGWPVEVAKVNK